MAKGKGSRLGVWIIVGLLFVGLIGFGSAGLVTGARTVATVGDKEITTQAYANAVRDELDAFSQQVGVPVSFAQVEPLGLPQAILAQVVSDRVLDNEADTLGISAGDDRIRAAVLADQRFRGLDGGFDREAYRFILNRRGETEREYEALLRDRLARSLLQGAVIGGIEADPVYADTVLSFVGAQRSFTWAEVVEADLTEEIAAPDEAALTEWFDANAEAYMSPEVREVTYAWLTPEMLGSDIEVDDAAVQELYDERISDYVQPERRLVERLVFSTDAAAEAALGLIENGENDFEALVIQRGLDLADVDMGDVGPSDLGDAADAVFAASPGDVVGPFATPLGPALFRMNAVLAAQEVPFEDAREELSAEVATARARRQIQDIEEQLADLIAGGATLEDVAERTDLVLGEMAWSEGVASGPAAYDRIREAIGMAEEGAPLEMVELDDGGVFLVRLDAIVPPAPQSLDDVRAQVTEDVIAARTQAQIADLAEGYAASLGDGSDFADLGLEARSEESLLRRDFVAGTPEGFMDVVFGMAPGEVTTVPSEAGTIIVRLDDTAPVDMDSETMRAERADIEGQITSGIAQDIYAAFTAELRSQTDIDVDQSAVEAVNAQFR